MPIKGYVKRPSERSQQQHLNVNWSLDGNYRDRTTAAIRIDYGEPLRQIKRYTAANKLVINYDNMFVQDVYPKSYTNLPNIYGGNGSRYTSSTPAAWMGDKDDDISLHSGDSFSAAAANSQRLRGGKT